jgi:hypothetical protein
MNKKIIAFGIVSLFLLLCFSTSIVTALKLKNEAEHMQNSGTVMVNILLDEDLDQGQIDYLHRHLAEGSEYSRWHIQLEKVGFFVAEDIVEVNSIGSYFIKFENVEPSRIGNKYSIDIRALFPGFVINRNHFNVNPDETVTVNIEIRDKNDPESSNKNLFENPIFLRLISNLKIFSIL